ncbi:MAG: hypothetical protein IH939_20490 [Acidobacteria bacterium]|nr:hypothetical protein [Acidobacteriota bacterium]
MRATKRTAAARKRAGTKAWARRARKRATQKHLGPAALARIPKTTRSRPGGTPPGELERIAVRRQKAMALRVQGGTYRQIADALDVSVFTAHEDVNAELLAVCTKTRGDTEQLRALILERSDFVLRGLAPAVMKGDPPSCLAWIRTLELQAKIGGLLTPTNVRPGDSSPTADLTAMEIAQRVASLVEFSRTGQFPRGKISDVIPVR